MLARNIIIKAFRKITAGKMDIEDYVNDREEMENALDILDYSLSVLKAEHEWNTTRVEKVLSFSITDTETGIKTYDIGDINIDEVEGFKPIRLSELYKCGSGVAISKGQLYTKGLPDKIKILTNDDNHIVSSLDENILFEPLNLLISLMAWRLALGNRAWYYMAQDFEQDYKHLLDTYKAKDVKQSTKKWNNKRRTLRKSMF
jgi:hypothetical protein